MVPQQPKPTLPGDTLIPPEYQGQRGMQGSPGPMAQTAAVEMIIPRFIRKAGLEVAIERTDDGWLYRITRPVVEVIEDGVEVGGQGQDH
jgi:hypothetical protein